MLKNKNCSDGQCFFNFTKKDMNETFIAPFNFSQCQESYSLPAVEDDKWHLHGDLILICINRVKYEISTFSFDAVNAKLTQTNVITMPMTEFLGAAIDMEMRMLILFTYSSDSTDAYIGTGMVVHFFAVENSVIWKANTSVSMSGNTV